jgi:hypothetical protein
MEVNSFQLARETKVYIQGCKRWEQEPENMRMPYNGFVMQTTYKIYEAHPLDCQYHHMMIYLLLNYIWQM